MTRKIYPFTMFLVMLCAITTVSAQPEVQEMYARGQEHFKARRWDDAIREYTEVIRRRPDVSGVYHSRALCYYNMKVSEPKLTYQQQADLTANLKPGEVQPKSQNSLNAIADFTKAIELQPGAASYASYYWRGQTYKWENDLEPAILDLEKFIQLYPNYESDPNFSGAMIHLTKAGNEYASALSTRGFYEIVMLSYSTIKGDARTPQEIKRDEEDERRINNLFKKAVRFYKPVNPGTFAARARAYLQLKDLAAAISDFKEAVKQNPKDPSLANELASAYKKNNQFDLAIAEYSRVLAMPDTYSSIKIEKNNAHYRRAEVYFDQNRLGEALADLNSVITNVPTYYVAYFLRGKVYAKQKKKELARADFIKAAETNGLRKVVQIELDVLDGKVKPNPQAAKTDNPATRPASAAVNATEPAVAFVSKPAPEPFESQFRKEMQAAMGQNDPSWYRGVAFLNLAAGLQKSGRQEKEIGDLLANKLLEMAYIDFFVVYKYILVNKNFKLSMKMSEQLLGGLTREMRKKITETSSAEVQAYLNKTPAPKIAEIFKPGYGWGKTVSSNIK